MEIFPTHPSQAHAFSDRLGREKGGEGERGRQRDRQSRRQGEKIEAEYDPSSTHRGLIRSIDTAVQERHDSCNRSNRNQAILPVTCRIVYQRSV